MLKVREHLNGALGLLYLGIHEPVVILYRLYRLVKLVDLPVRLAEVDGVTVLCILRGLAEVREYLADLHKRKRVRILLAEVGIALRIADEARGVLGLEAAALGTHPYDPVEALVGAEYGQKPDPFNSHLFTLLIVMMLLCVTKV